jgi:hypothetical protein
LTDPVTKNRIILFDIISQYADGANHNHGIDVGKGDARLLPLCALFAMQPMPLARKSLRGRENLSIDT